MFIFSQMDFLTIDPCAEEYKEIDAILLDPSCSGSGTAFSRQDDVLPSSRQSLCVLPLHGVLKGVRILFQEAHGVTGQSARGFSG